MGSSKTDELFEAVTKKEASHEKIQQSIIEMKHEQIRQKEEIESLKLQIGELEHTILQMNGN